jgi:hypothetical protein
MLHAQGQESETADVEFNLPDTSGQHSNCAARIVATSGRGRNVVGDSGLVRGVGQGVGGLPINCE